MEMGGILITGASRGLGAALATRYATPGQRLILTARSLKALSDISRVCRDQGAQISPLVLDLDDPDSVDAFHVARRRLDLGAGGLSLVIANAGVFAGRSSFAKLEGVDAQVHQINVNLTANIALLTPIAEEMRKAGRGHIAVVSSLAARQPQPDSPAYSASKAGLSAWAKAMADDLAEAGIHVTDIQPGHIDTAQTEGHQGLLPGLMSAEKAATIIHRGLAQKKRQIAFPLSIAWLIWLTNWLPDPLRRLALKPYRYQVRSPHADLKAESKD